MDPRAKSANALRQVVSPCVFDYIIHGNVPFGGHLLELGPIGWVDLGTEGCSKDELPDTARKARWAQVRDNQCERRSGVPCKEGIEGEVCNKDTVEELDDAREHQEDQERVDGLETRRGCVVVSPPQRQ